MKIHDRLVENLQVCPYFTSKRISNANIERGQLQYTGGWHHRHTGTHKMRFNSRRCCSHTYNNTTTYLKTDIQTNKLTNKLTHTHAHHATEIRGMKTSTILVGVVSVGAIASAHAFAIPSSSRLAFPTVALQKQR